MAARPKSIPHIFNRIIFDTINKRNKHLNFRNRLKKQILKLANICQLQKTADILPRHRWFFHEMKSEKRVRKFHTDDASLPRSGQFAAQQAWPRRKFASAKLRLATRECELLIAGQENSWPQSGSGHGLVVGIGFVGCVTVNHKSYSWLNKSYIGRRNYLYSFETCTFSQKIVFRNNPDFMASRQPKDCKCLWLPVVIKKTHKTS